MISHDPLCPCSEQPHTHYQYRPSGLCVYCRCELIRAVEARAVQRVEALDTTGIWGRDLDRADVIAAIKGEQA
jgi:hypothetical protein